VIDFFSQAQPDLEFLSETELQTLAERYFPAPKAFQELLLVLASESLLSLPVARLQQDPTIRESTKVLLERVRLNDQLLRIERRRIPHIPLYIPDTPKGRQFFKIAEAIGEIPLCVPVLPKNQNQGYWLKALHHYWQARGVVLAHQLLGLIPDPIGKFGSLRNRLPVKGLKHLRCSRAIDIACLRVLLRGRRTIQRWATTQGIDYPFKHPFELFIELQKQDFLTLWQLGPQASDAEWLSKRVQRGNLTNRVALLREGIWQEQPLFPLANRQRQEYLEYLQEDGWRGYWILALQGQISRAYDQPARVGTRPENKHLEPYLAVYLEALVQGKELFVDELLWQGGQPYKRRLRGEKVTNSAQRLQGHVNCAGYLVWD
jgi:hypothetical protein